MKLGAKEIKLKRGKERREKLQDLEDASLKKYLGTSFQRCQTG